MKLLQQRIFQEVRVKRGEFKAQLEKRYFERFQWPLGLALAFLVVESFLSDRRLA